MLCDGCGIERDDLIWVEGRALCGECRAGAEVEDTTVDNG